MLLTVHWLTRHTVETSLGHAKCLCCLQPLQLHLTQAWVYANLDTCVRTSLQTHHSHACHGGNRTKPNVDDHQHDKWCEVMGGIGWSTRQWFLKVNDQNETGFWVTWRSGGCNCHIQSTFCLFILASLPLISSGHLVTDQRLCQHPLCPQSAGGSPESYWVRPSDTRHYYLSCADYSDKLIKKK